MRKIERESETEREREEEKKNQYEPFSNASLLNTSSKHELIAFWHITTSTDGLCKNNDNYTIPI